MVRKHIVKIVAIVVFLLAGSLLAMASAAVDQIGVLSGTVTTLVATGTTVHEGDILVRVDTLAGSVPAARATTKGVVTQVLVKQGDSIKIGDVVARIEVAK